jgi:hypothetical protein
MSEVDREVAVRLAAANEQLVEILKERAEAEAAVVGGETQLAQSRAALQAILDREGSQRGLIGDLKHMVEALEKAADPKP